MSTKKNTFCECQRYCLNTQCRTSDSRKKVRNCWCAECKEVRKEIKKNAYTIVEATMTFEAR